MDFCRNLSLIAFLPEFEFNLIFAGIWVLLDFCLNLSVIGFLPEFECYWIFTWIWVLLDFYLNLSAPQELSFERLDCPEIIGYSFSLKSWNHLCRHSFIFILVTIVLITVTVINHYIYYIVMKINHYIEETNQAFSTS